MAKHLFFFFFNKTISPKMCVALFYLFIFNILTNTVSTYQTDITPCKLKQQNNRLSSLGLTWLNTTYISCVSRRSGVQE